MIRVEPTNKPPRKEPADDTASPPLHQTGPLAKPGSPDPSMLSRRSTSRPCHDDTEAGLEALESREEGSAKARHPGRPLESLRHLSAEQQKPWLKCEPPMSRTTWYRREAKKRASQNLCP